MDKNKKWTIYWRDGKKSVISGETIEGAFTAAGYGAGAMPAVDFYMEGDDSAYAYNNLTHEWDKK